MEQNEFKKEIIKLIRKYKPDRIYLSNILREIKRDRSVIEIIGPVKKRKPKKLPKLPTMDQIQKLLDLIEQDGKLKYRLMIKMLLYTGMRREELVNLKKSDVRISDNTIFVEDGKGGKDRIIPIFKIFRENLLLYMDSIPYNKYLFENRHSKPYTGRYLAKIFQNYRQQIKNFPDVHPHTMRHVFLTYLTKCGWSDAQIMLISGHDSKDSLKIYQHLALPDVDEKFQRDMVNMGV